MRLKQQPERLAAASHGVQLHHRVGESRRGAAHTTAGQLSAPPYTSALCARCKSNAVAVARIQKCYLWSWQAGRQCLFGRQGVEGVDAPAAGGKGGGKGPLGAPTCSLLSWCFAVSGCCWGCWAAAPRAGGEGACQRSRSGGRQRRAQPWQEVHTALERGSEPRTEVPVQLRPMPTCHQMASCPTGPFSGRHSTAPEPVFLPLTHQQRVQPAGSPPHNGAAVGAL